ncbi:iron ABC transporter substrate-binding protein [Desulfovibrio aerotolerans]|uniref:Iron ABC transporter substrate-binding protein n=1 Tax=Solidesulfovibrio aerotolerans TaxID=295255 RepID=A0A7C9IT02_9BACT|nr:ABC transporter substrate-binding protein [Solidesulfovibrio aerotolerans]MYL81880.1 iron ABC transporter substrate-binding protein [Solidesulfovibrio aerotolerans]
MPDSHCLETPVLRYIADHPGARDILIERGVAAVADAEFMASAAPFLAMRTLLTLYGIAPQLFLDALASAVPGRRGGMTPLFTDGWTPSGPGLRGFVSLPCPLKAPMGLALDNLRQSLPAGAPWPRLFMDSCGKHTLNDLAANLTRPEEVPDMVISAGLNGFLSKSFRDRFAGDGLLARLPQDIHPALAAAGLADPRQVCRIYAVNPLVLVVVRSRLGGLPVPRSFDDLLDPVYAGKIGLCGPPETAGDSTLLLDIRLRHGLGALAALGRAMLCDTHPAQIFRPAPGSNPPPIGVMPYFFAMAAPRQDDVEIIWPASGALASPLFVMVKQAARDALAPLLDCFLGRQTAILASGAGMPATRPDAPVALPPGATVRFIGWDVLESHDLGPLIAEAGAVFAKAYYASRA